MRTVPRIIEESSRRRKLCLVLLLLTLSDLTSAFSWLGLYRETNFPTNIYDAVDCYFVREKYNITKKQWNLCQQRAQLMPYVQEAAEIAVHACQSLFRFKRWNCSTLLLLPEMLPDLKDDTKEHAFVDAIGAAALTYTVARACSSFTIDECTCGNYPDYPPDGSFKWGGCGDNVVWAAEFSKQFHDMRPPPSDNRARKRRTRLRGEEDIEHNRISRIQNHNSEVGRRVVSGSLETQCKCHGVSGSCSVKTCWKGLPFHFRDVAAKLMPAYATAERVSATMRPRLLCRRMTEMPHSLVFTNAVDYCESRTDHFRTHGRECNSSAQFADQCDHVCCKRGHVRRERQILERCNCQYNPSWFNVTCETCRLTKKVTVCN